MASKHSVDLLLNVILARQGDIGSIVPVGTKFLARGRKGRLVISGPLGTVRYFRFDGSRLLEEDDPVGCRNTLEMTTDTFLDICLGLIRPREAVAAGLVHITGDIPKSEGKVLYDREEFLQALDRMAALLTTEVRSRVPQVTGPWARPRWRGW